jgi:hypothetical protein
MPGSIADNASFLGGRVRGVMACLFEHAPKLPNRLPASRHALAWHVHLPTDLPWDDGTAAGERACAAMETVRHLADGATLAVLHHPPSLRCLEAFMRPWKAAGWKAEQLLLENVPEADMAALPSWCDRVGAGLCLDVSHLALFGNLTHAVHDSTLLARIRMVHWSAPRGGKDAHAPLGEIAAELVPACRLLAETVRDCVDVIEVFNWQSLQDSWDTLRAWKELQAETACALNR